MQEQSYQDKVLKFAKDVEQLTEEALKNYEVAIDRMTNPDHKRVLNEAMQKAKAGQMTTAKLLAILQTLK